MSPIDAINTSVATQAQNTGTSGPAGIMGKEDFLTLLVAQLKNQDPLNPDDPTEFTGQLAQFSSLEQLFNLNESMGTVAGSVADSQKLSALGLIGKEVAYADSEFVFSGDPVRIGYSLDGEASDITLKLLHNGKPIASLAGTDLGPGNHYLTWDGMLDDNNGAPFGNYTIVIEAAAADGSVAAAPLVRSEVTGVDLSAGGGGLLITASGEVNLSDLKGVYEAGSPLPISATDTTTVTAAAAVADGQYRNRERIERTGPIYIDGTIRSKFVSDKFGPDYGKSMKIVFNTGEELFVPDTTRDVNFGNMGYRPGGDYTYHKDVDQMEVYARPGSLATSITVYY